MKERLDVLLVSKGYFESREKAQRSIMAGLVFVGGQREDKAGTKVDVDCELEVRGDTCPYVSRGGLKLEKSLKTWPFDLKGAVCMDIGSSTGGFTDCMLQNGASKVYAVDVGTNQLAYKLRVDERVVVMEQTNIRDVNPVEFEKLDFISVDVSFISLKHIFPVATELLKPDTGKMVCLVKPQFEAGREKVGKGGIIKDPKVHLEVINTVIEYALEYNLYPSGLTFSPVTGAKGNIEYLLYLTKNEAKTADFSPELPEKIVEQSHKELTQN